MTACGTAFWGPTGQSFEKGGNHCGCLKKTLTLLPGEEARLLFLLGEGGVEAGRAMREKYTRERADADFRRLAEFWDRKLRCLQVETPNEGMNTELNIWNLYQSEINVMFSRFTSFIEVGGRATACTCSSPAGLNRKQRLSPSARPR